MSQSTEGVSSTGTLSRFEAFLKPCRDLAANWNVDIVEKLTDYLTELDIDISSIEDETLSRAHVNFQHAALVIEGGTCIYSRKVDYLYGLVFAAADMIFEARGKSKPSENATALTTAAEDDADGTPVNDDTQFLLLDDGLIADQPDEATITLPVRNTRDREESHRLRESNRILSVPLHLLPPGPQLSRKSIAENPNNVGLRMREASINRVTGALVLDGIGVGDEEHHICTGSVSGPEDTSPGALTPAFGQGTPFSSRADGDGDEDDDDMAPVEAGDIFNGDDGRDEDLGIAELSDPQGIADGSAACVMQAVARAAPALFAADPFAPLVPHNDMGIAHRPLKPGRTWTCPQTLFERSLRADQAPECDESSSLATRVFGPGDAIFLRKTSRFVHCAAFENDFKSRSRSLAAALRKRRRCGTSTDTSGNGVSLFGNAGNDVCALDGVDDVVNDGQNDFDDGNISEADERSDGTLNEFASDGLDDVPDAVPLLLNDSGGVSRASDLDVEQLAASYEEACRRYLQESNALWQEHAADSKLEKRVSEWRSKIEPLLLLEEGRRDFDIQEYGAAIIERFESHSAVSKSSETDMCSILGASDSSEVCRNFLAALQLVNNNELGIAHTSASGESALNPTMRLLKGDGSQEESASVRAPSTRQTGPLEEIDTANVNQGSYPSASPARKARRSGKRTRQVLGSPGTARRLHTSRRTRRV